MTAPAIRGDILIVRDLSDEFVIVDPITKERLAGPFPTLRATLQCASQLHRDGAIWHQSVDERGRELEPPTRLPVRLGMDGQ